MIPIERNDVDNKFSPDLVDWEEIIIHTPTVMMDFETTLVLCQTIQSTITTLQSGSTFLYHRETDTVEMTQNDENHNRISELTIILERLYGMFPDIRSQLK